VFESKEIIGFDNELFMDSSLTKYIEGDTFKAIYRYHWINKLSHFLVYLKLTNFSRFNHLNNFYQKYFQDIEWTNSQKKTIKVAVEFLYIF